MQMFALCSCVVISQHRLGKYYLVPFTQYLCWLNVRTASEAQSSKCGHFIHVFCDWRENLTKRGFPTFLWTRLWWLLTPARDGGPFSEREEDLGRMNEIAGSSMPNYIHALHLLAFWHNWRMASISTLVFVVVILTVLRFIYTADPTGENFHRITSNFHLTMFYDKTNILIVTILWDKFS
jgi:hypothetical protein